MNNRPIFQKIANVANSQKLSVSEIESLDAGSIGALVSLTTDEVPEYRKHHRGIKQLLVKQFKRKKRIVELAQIIEAVRTAGFQNVQGRLQGKDRITLWPNGGMPEEEK